MRKGGGRGSANSRLHGLVIRDGELRLRYQVVNPTLEDARRFEGDGRNALCWERNWDLLDDRFALAVPPDAANDGLEPLQVALLLGAAVPSTLVLDGQRWYSPYMLQVHSRERSQGVGRLGMMLAAARARDLECVGLAMQVLAPSVSAGARRLQQSIGSRQRTFRTPDGDVWKAEPRCTTWCIDLQRTVELAQAFEACIEQRRRP